MEWLGQLIRSEITDGRWHPIRLSTSGPYLSDLVFADDLVIFGKVKMDQVLLLKEILNRFCAFSGHKISVRKSNIYFSKDFDTSLGDQISQLFGFQKVLNLGNYLRVPLLHKRVTKSTLNFVVEKVRSKLQNWEARKLSFAGRVTLAQSVLLAIPNYFMQSLLVPKGVCDEIEKIARACGGLGFRHLQDQNNSFLMKIGFNLTSRKDALWSQLPDSIHRSNCSHLWRSLSKVWPLFCENIMWSVGDGSTIRGWKDT
ncbi:Retrovirus-related Pol polyprotein LINE-1 [Gossypium australe]|uniref:Retrovirus-related Pol polyprotein LINE-1 n=1 Tax=Gossypium australe TaxID=47621 RepID=A0A5B6VZ29_9ROSI|nr:Retrovirus-related Pol polyprotein LINE-1 [Gossypium australe]